MMLLQRGIQLVLLDMAYDFSLVPVLPVDSLLNTQTKSEITITDKLAR
jgi:hypothetical protein